MIDLLEEEQLNDEQIFEELNEEQLNDKQMFEQLNDEQLNDEQIFEQLNDKLNDEQIFEQLNEEQLNEEQMFEQLNNSQLNNSQLNNFSQLGNSSWTYNNNIKLYTNVSGNCWMTALLSVFTVLPDIVLDQLIIEQTDHWLKYLTFLFVQAVREKRTNNINYTFNGITTYFELLLEYFEQHKKIFNYFGFYIEEIFDDSKQNFKQTKLIDEQIKKLKQTKYDFVSIHGWKLSQSIITFLEQLKDSPQDIVCVDDQTYYSSLFAVFILYPFIKPDSL